MPGLPGLWPRLITRRAGHAALPPLLPTHGFNLAWTAAHDEKAIRVWAANVSDQVVGRACRGPFLGRYQAAETGDTTTTPPQIVDRGARLFFRCSPQPLSSCPGADGGGPACGWKIKPHRVRACRDVSWRRTDWKPSREPVEAFSLAAARFAFCSSELSPSLLCWGVNWARPTRKVMVAWSESKTDSNIAHFFSTFGAGRIGIILLLFYQHHRY